MGREWTEPLLLAANAIDSADLALLPGVFHVLERGFHASPAQLAGLVLAQSWLKGLAYPLWGYVAVAFYTTMHWTASADRELFLESRATQEQQLQEDHHDGSRAESSSRCGSKGARRRKVLRVYAIVTRLVKSTGGSCSFSAGPTGE
jgi:hypothetical protein